MERTEIHQPSSPSGEPWAAPTPPPTARRSRWLAAGGLVAAVGVAPATTATAADPPANDLFANATEITLDFAETIDTTMATTGEPEDFAGKNICGSPPFDSPAPPDATVWYSLTTDEAVSVSLSTAPPTYSSGFNVIVEVAPGEYECVAGGPVETGFVSEPGVTYFIQVIEDQLDGGGNGGILNFSAVSTGPPAPELCPGISPSEPRLPPGLNLIVGTDGDDDIQGTPGDDLIFGLEGNDRINGGGDDVILGCAGDDVINGGDGNDLIFADDPGSIGDPGSTAGGFGDDDVNGGQGDDFVAGGFDSDQVNGGPGNDFVNGDVPAPFPDDSPHNDSCSGGQGDDTVVNCEAVAGNGN